MYPILRVARPTNSISALLPFYVEGLGFEKISEFKDHSSFDGVILGHPKAPYHLEFTTERGVLASGAPSAEHLLVFYLPDESEYQERINKMESAGFTSVKSHNSWWDNVGKTFVDPDGYRVVLYFGSWEK